MKDKITKIKLSRMGKEYEILSKIFHGLKTSYVTHGDTIFFNNKYEILFATDIKTNKLLFSIKNIWNEINLFRIDSRRKYDLIKVFIDLYFPQFSNFKICTIDDLIPCGTTYKWVNEHNINKTLLYDITLENFTLYKVIEKVTLTKYSNTTAFEIDDLIYHNGSSYIKFDSKTKKQTKLFIWNIKDYSMNLIRLDHNNREDNKIFYKSRPHFLLRDKSTNYFFR